MKSESYIVSLDSSKLDSLAVQFDPALRKVLIDSFLGNLAPQFVR